MATTKKKADDAPEVVRLKCDTLGVESQDFTPKHAKALLDWEAERGLNNWQPVDAAATE